MAKPPAKPSKAPIAAPAPNAPVQGQRIPIGEDPELEGLMSEIDEDLRTQEIKKLWAQHGNAIMSGLVVVVLAVLGWQYWQNQVVAERAALGKSYGDAMALVADGKTEEAITAFAAVAGSRGEGFAVLAQLQKAALLAEKQDLAGALAAYTALSEDSSADPLFRDVATVLYVMHALDTEDPAKLEAKLTPLLNPDNTYHGSAVELAALLAHKQGDTARAIGLIEPLVNNPDVPGGVRARAEELLSVFKAPVVAPPPAPVTPPAAAETPPPG
ncbi:MAG: tetratricopeptide repeat protein [Alphaproteobacteria bacterium]|nr:tetratricopeptide repeat protein [Alphaproteobacteria bacterium]